MGHKQGQHAALRNYYTEHCVVYCKQQRYHDPMNDSAHNPLQKSSRFLMLCTGITAVVILILCAYFFTGFLGGGRTGIGIAQAFLLCFGAGALAYLPLLCVFFMARHVHSFGAKRSIGIASILISLPMWGFGAAGLVIQHPFWLYGLPLMAIGLIILFWGVTVLRAGITAR